MNLIHTKLARSIWLFDIRDLNPMGKDILGDLVAWVKEAYAFAVAPDPANPIPNPTPVLAPTPQTAPRQASGGLVFQRGRFKAQQEVSVAIASLTIYTDGLVIDTTSSTDDGDQFAEGLLTGAARELKLSYDAGTVRRKLYLSELIVRSELTLESLNPSLAAFAEKLPTSLSGGESLRFGVGSVAFWSEPNDAGLHRVIRIERQLGRAFSENRFYSDAPLPTVRHIQLLEDFEKAVMEGDSSR